MKFEKLNNDKIRITLNIKDLQEKDIDFQSFMSNSSDAQKLFLDMLEEAEKEIGFTTKDYRIMIEALATMEGDFILTVTRFLPDDSLVKKRNIKFRRKNTKLDSETAVYAFQSFEDFCSFFRAGAARSKTLMALIASKGHVPISIAGTAPGRNAPFSSNGYLTRRAAHAILGTGTM